MTRYTRNRLERKRDVGCRLKATVGTFLETMPDDAFQRESDLCWHATEFDRIFVENRVQRFNRGVAMERAAAGQHFVKHRAKRKDVGAPWGESAQALTGISFLRWWCPQL